MSCGSTEDDVCSAKCDCEGCSDREYDDCVNRFDDDANRADRYDCADLYDRWLDCQDQTGYCHAGDYSSDCGPEEHSFENCVGEPASSGCITNNDCGGSHPYCGPGGECVECIAPTECGAAQTCVNYHCK